MTTIITKNSSTASAAPVAGDLTKGELAVNVTDKKLYTKDNGGSVVKLVGSLGNQEASAVAITGGTITGSSIDGTTVGSTTTAAGAFTTLAASGLFTLSGGTANGVGYLNGSKQFTTGSALTFDGTNLGVGGTAGIGLPVEITGATSGVAFKTSASNFTYGAIYTTTSLMSVQAGQSGTGAYVPMAFSVSGSEGMRLTSTGLGIGTSSPNAAGWDKAVTINGSTSSALEIEVGGSRKGEFAALAGGVYLQTVGAIPIIFSTNSSEKMRLDSSGNLLVGTTNATPFFGTSEGSVINGSYIGSSRSGGPAIYVNRYTSTGTSVDFRYDGSTVGTISVTASATAYNTSSDYRLKDNQQPLTGSGAFIDALQPKTWDWKADGSKGVGFIAHEVQAVSPGSVVGEKDAVDEDGKPKYQAMEYGSAEFIANIIAELQSVRKRLAALEGK